MGDGVYLSVPKRLKIKIHSRKKWLLTKRERESVRACGGEEKDNS